MTAATPPPSADPDPAADAGPDADEESVAEADRRNGEPGAAEEDG
jgi:hypothetical protein